MNPEQLEAHCLLEIERMKAALELIRTQKSPPGERVRQALEALAYACSLASEPLTAEEALDGSFDRQSR